MLSLKEQFNLKMAEAQKALENMDVEGVRKLREEAEVIKAAIKESQALDALRTIEPEPVRPPFPGGGAAPLPTIDAQDSPEQTGAAPALSAAYITRFGDPDRLTKSILTELHGSDYVEKYWLHKAAFNRFLRAGEKALTREDDKRLREIVFTPASIRAAMQQGIYDVAVLRSTMVEASDELGGYIVPVDFQARVIERLAGFTVVRPRAQVLTTSRDALQLPVATGGDSQYTSAIRVTWVDETPTAGTGETNLTFGLENVPIHTVMAEVPLSLNLLEDAAFPLETYISRKFAEASAIDEDNQFLVGLGGGSPQGILPGSANTLSITEANSGNASALTWDGLITLVYSIDAQYRQNAAFVAEKATYQAIRKLADGISQYYWEPVQQAGQPLMLLGYPVLEQEGMPSIASNAYPIIFGDIGGYVIADRVGMSVTRFIDSATYRQNLAYFVMRRRLGGHCVETWRFAVQKVSA